MEQILSYSLTYLESIITLTYFKAFFIFLSFFLILIMLGFVRKHYFRLTMKGATFGFLLGTLFVIVVEAVLLSFFLLGTDFFPVLSGQRKIDNIVQLSKQSSNKLSKVLGVTICPQEKTSLTNILEQLPTLQKEEEDKIREIICR